jgi:hypothetical protein
MRQISQFARAMEQTVLTAIFLTFFIASLSTHLEAAMSSPDTQVAADKSNQGSPTGQDKKPPKDKDCEGPPDSCYSTTNLSSPDPTGCTSGAKCTFEGKVCNPMTGAKCKTNGAPGPCYCACM